MEGRPRGAIRIIYLSSSAVVLPSIYMLLGNYDRKNYIPFFSLSSVSCSLNTNFFAATVAGESSVDAHVAVDMNIVASCVEELRERRKRATSRCGGGGSCTPCSITIGMVGELTRNVAPQEYEPYHVSIGPYHRAKNPHISRDDEKLVLFDDVRAARSDAIVTEDVYMKEMCLLEARARSCYPDPFNMESKEFVHMLLLDACYILDRFSDVGDAGRRHRRRNDPSVVVANGHVEGQNDSQLEDVKVVHDVWYLAENQIPFFAIKKVHELATGESDTRAAVDAVLWYIRELLKKHHYSVAKAEVAALSEVGNLLHLLHMHLKPTTTGGGGASTATGDDGGNKPNTEQLVGRWHSATDYHYAGVRFKSRPVGDHEGEAQCILDVGLGGGGGGTLLVPRLNLNAQTLGLLRNLMELEQRNPAVGSHVTAYCVFMWQVACTAGDVELLSKGDVIVHSLGNNAEVADFFSNLCKGLVFDVDDHRKNYLCGTWQVLEKRFQNRPRRWMAWLHQKHFRNPWKAIGLVAATVLLLCTLAQAVYAVLSYYSPKRAN